MVDSKKVSRTLSSSPPKITRTVSPPTVARSKSPPTTRTVSPPTTRAISPPTTRAVSPPSTRAVLPSPEEPASNTTPPPRPPKDIKPKTEPDRDTGNTPPPELPPRVISPTVSGLSVQQLEIIFEDFSQLFLRLVSFLKLFQKFTQQSLTCSINRHLCDSMKFYPKLTQCFVVLKAHKPKVKRVQAVFDCEADNDDELSFSEGEIIIVSGEADPEWWVS